MRQYLAMTAALIALGACSGADKKAETATSGTPQAVASAPAAAPSISAEAMAEMDKIQAGKWSITTSMSGQAMPATEVCVEKNMSFQEQQEAQKQNGVSCSEQSYRREGDQLVGHSVCTMKGMSGVPPMTITTDMSITGDLKTAYTMDMSTKIDPPPPNGMGAMKMTIAAKRIGDCDAQK